MGRVFSGLWKTVYGRSGPDLKNGDGHRVPGNSVLPAKETVSPSRLSAVSVWKTRGAGGADHGIPRPATLKRTVEWLSKSCLQRWGEERREKLVWRACN
jgi:hypothetical protein